MGKQPVWFPLFVVLMVSFLFQTSFAGVHSPEARKALVIGNADYPFAPLRNPVNDARAITDTLRSMGFSVTKREDVDLQGMDLALSAFSREVQAQSSVVLFYYAGHAVQVHGKNYLLPTDFSAVSKDDISDKAICLDEILRNLESQNNNVNIIVLDACRTNPLDADNEAYKGQDRSVRGITFKMRKQGLAPMKGISGTFIAFSTSPGRPAYDGDGIHGLYTKYLLHYLKSPAHTIEEIFKKVRVAVLKDSGQEQVPWERSSLINDFYFIPPDKETATRKTVRDLIQEARVDIASQRYGVAYNRLKLANKMAGSQSERAQIQSLTKQIRKELGID